jgi:hypothetical protein
VSATADTCRACAERWSSTPGRPPLTRPVHRHTWQTLSRNWDVDVQHVFNWTREALLLPLEPDSVVIACRPEYQRTSEWLVLRPGTG